MAPQPEGPREIPFEQLHTKNAKESRGPGRPPKPKPASLTTGLELCARGLFALPALLGQGDHWYLTEPESKAIAEQANAALTSLPVKRLEQLTKLSSIWAPWIGLTVTLGVCAISRIQYTQTLRGNHVRTRAPGVRAPDAPSHGAATDGGAPAGNGAAPGAGAAKNRVADYLRESEGPGSAGGGDDAGGAGG